jgi:plasmid rolling circle replication initiator protein Rep
MTRLSTEFESILEKYKKHKLDTYKVLELLGTDYTFTDWGADTTDKRYAALLNCGTFLDFRKCREEGKTVYHLAGANFCRQRVCPMCQFRRSERMFAETLRVVKHLEEQYRFIHLVLTIPNAQSGQELREGIQILFKGFNKLMQYKQCRGAFKGVLRCLEVSMNPDNGTFHPHLHCLIAVNISYFHDTKAYVSYNTLRELWTKAVKAAIASVPFDASWATSDYLLQISVRACKKYDYVGVAEVCKYCVKPLDVEKYDDEYMAKRLMLTLWHTLKGQRFVQKYGIVRTTWKELFGFADQEPDEIQQAEAEGEQLAFRWDSDTLSYRGEED